MINNIIGKYRVTQLIGEGGMASVYEAEHEMLKTRVAIKVLNPILSANAQIKERFRNEAKLMASLDHPNIIKVIDFDEQPQQLSIIMEFLDGEDLNHRIKRSGALTDQQIADVFSQTLSAFQYAHEKGIVHRDIKPSNIFILQNGHVKILDFGIAKLFGQGNEMTQTGTQMGTPIYMSPEQVKADKSIDHRSDIYSLGVTLFFAINGQPPYNVDTHSQFDIYNKIVFEPLPEVKTHEAFQAILAKACHKDREQRFQSCQEWIRAIPLAQTPSASSLANATGRLSEEQRPIEDSNSARPIDLPIKKSKTKPILFVAIAIAVVFAVGFLSFRYYEKSQVGKGVELFKEKEYEKAFQVFNSSLLDNNAEAQFYLGKMYWLGLYVEKNEVKAFSFAQKSADQGFARGLNLLGRLYELGAGIKQDYSLAFENYTKGANLGSAQGYYNLGRLYSLGNGVETDYNKAIENYNKAIDIEDEKSENELEGESEYFIGITYEIGGYGIKKDLIQAKQYYLRAIDKGNAGAAVNLGVMYEYGNGVSKEYATAFKYYTIAANLTDGRGQAYLGTLYLDGKGCEQDDYKAFELFKKSADQDSEYGLAYLGYMYEMGKGGAGYNMTKARQYYKRAASKGNQWAKNRLKN